jgi:hypothetical protein
MEATPALPIRQAKKRLAILGEQVERDEHDRDLAVAGEHPLAQAREARQAVVAERDQFSVVHPAAWEVSSRVGTT